MLQRFLERGGIWQVLCVVMLGLIIYGGLAAGGDHALQGQPAPTFKLSALQGDPIDLDLPLGEQVIVLDFWASWCPPCREGLPIIAKVASDYADKGVVTYAVNVGESREEVQVFVRDTRLKVPVLLDESTGIAEKYGVNGIPQTVIIGRDGIVREVHVGLPYNMEEDLHETLDLLLAEPAGGEAAPAPAAAS